ncbi:MAG: glycerol-3-phosphate 1-acyltransferase [Monoraphidium minutum]|nr:MAG: glycerol-3-phosphate 1-acyltransferase [Monoraphidium minutum]
MGALEPPPADPSFAPFIRHDSYGEAGHRIGPFQALRIAVLSVTLLPARLAASLLCVASYYIILRMLRVLPEGVLNRRVSAFWGRFWSSACLLSLGFWRIRRVRMEPRRSPSLAKLGRRPRWQVAIVSNHIGWADILIHMSRNLPSFVARDGTQDIRMIGLISRRIECIYVDREKKNGGGQSNGGVGVGEQVRRRMLHSWEHPEEEHRPMLLFPEGTTSNGSHLLPFKTGAFLAGVPVQPIVIKYGGKARVSPAWESISALRHLLLMLTTPFHTATCYELPIYYPSPEEQADPRLYAANVRQYMLDHSGLRPSDSTLEDKRLYQADLKRRLAAAKGGGGGGGGGAAAAKKAS